MIPTTFLTMLLCAAMCGKALASPASPPLPATLPPTTAASTLTAEAPPPDDDLGRISARAPLEKRLGINCRGSGNCGHGNRLSILTALIYTLRNNATFGGGEQIACNQYYDDGSGGAFCAFLQNVGDDKIDAQTIKAKVRDLWDHGCKTCGSVPLHEGNDVKKGQLTVNYVDDAVDGCGGHKVCKDENVKAFDELVKEC